MNPMLPIPDYALRIGMRVHVEGWSGGCQFIYFGTFNGTHRLMTPKTKKPYLTQNQLLYTRRNQPQTLSESSRPEVTAGAL